MNSRTSGEIQKRKKRLERFEGLEPVEDNGVLSSLYQFGSKLVKKEEPKKTEKKGLVYIYVFHI